MDRRTFLIGAGALAASPACAADVSRRVFRIMRDGSEIGTHALEAWVSPKGFEITITIDIAVKVLGITAYRYTLRNREVWKGGTLLALDSLVNDDGTEEQSTVRRGAGVLEIAGTRYTGDGPLSAAPTSYYTPKFLDRTPWISTQSGDLLPVSITPKPGRSGWWTVTGGLDTSLGYDARGEWTGCEFDAGGSLATYEIVSQTGLIAPLWEQA